MAFISSDGYIRLSSDELGDLPLHHLITGLDEGELPPASDSQLSGNITGYTEWLSDGAPAVTVGWDWQMLSLHEAIGLQLVDLPRSNVMLIDPLGQDAGPRATALFLAQRLERLSWEGVALAYLTARYGR